MKMSPLPARRVRIGPKPWRSKIALSVGAAPLGLGCALLLYVVGLGIDRGWGFLDQLRSGSKSLPRAEIEHALVAVRASMADLPDDGDARAIAQFVTSSRMAWLENRQLTLLVRRLETQYAGLVTRYEANLVKQQESLNTARGEPGRLQDKRDAIAARVGTSIVERELTARPESSERRKRHPSSEPSEARHTVGEQLGIVTSAKNDFAARTTPFPSRISNTRLSSERSASFAALQIARKLDNTRRQALRSKLERILTIDVITLVLEAVPGSKLLQLDPALELHLIPASSEVIDERSGRIRFFPDGSSTGGRIQVQHDNDRATVNVDPPTGVVTVQVNGN